MSAKHIVPVIMSGGAGSRLWPLSRKAEPKQLLPLITDKTMLQETVARFDSDYYHDPVFICNKAHAKIIEKQMDEIGRDIGAIILEPIGRNTASCAVIAALHTLDLDPNSIFLLAPADHHIGQPFAFKAAIDQAMPVAQKGHLVTFGITPDHPATGFGYIRKGSAISDAVCKVEDFVEKPNLDIAKEYLASGEYFWNSGIFLFHPQTLLDEMCQYAPDVEALSRQAYEKATPAGAYINLDADIFSKIPALPVDKAVMEPTQKAAILPCDLDWHDIGSFKALHALKADVNGMALSGDVITEKTKKALISTDGPLVSVVGLENIAVIVKQGRVLVLNLDEAQSVKSVVEHLKHMDQTEWL